MTQSNTKPWRVYRFENAEGKYAEVASNEVGPNKIPLPPGYKFVSQRELVFVDALLSDALVDDLIEIVTAWSGETGTDHMAVTVKVREALTSAWTGEEH